jgi:4-amino-4-deoxy-L-arabinose transferase-like glycosyltransferase
VAVALPENQRKRAAALLVMILLAAWALCVWLQLRPAEIAADWHGWRQTDTQTIALNLTADDANIMMPRISWGGDGPGYVETEFQLYTWLVSRLLKIAGTAEWPGQLLSLLAMSAAALVVFSQLSRKYVPVAAVAGFVAFLAARIPAHMGSVVMPDALALLAYACAWLCFTRYANAGRARDLVAYGLAGTLAMLIKPTTAHLGISSFLLLLLAHRDRLREPRLWVVWALMVAVFGAYLAQAHRLYVEYGNTFGLLSGEDSKVPRLRNLLDPGLYMATARIAVLWGLGSVATLALIIQALRRRLDAEQVALLAGNVVIVFIAMRYMSDSAGIHYYAPILVLAASVIASLTNDLLKAGAWRHAAIAALGVLLVAQGYRSFSIRQDFSRHYADDPAIVAAGGVVAAGKALARLAKPGELVMVRSILNAYDPAWQQAINHHDPRIFYVSGTRGWTLGREQQDPRPIADVANRGAAFFVDPMLDGAPGLDAWLSANAEQVWSGTGGRIWKLRPAAGSRRDL